MASTSSATPTPSTPANPVRFRTIAHLGRGGQGFVQLAHDDLRKEEVAIKYIDRGGTNPRQQKYIIREILHHQQLSLCKHPHIVEFYEVFVTPRYLGIVMEYVKGCDLHAYLGKCGGTLPENVARFIFQQLMIAVNFCHLRGKVNRDIKLANILVSASGSLPIIKLCDFGFSKDEFEDSAAKSQVGTALFAAPEIFTTMNGEGYDAIAADIWSCGVVLCLMLYGSHPFLGPGDLTPPQEQHLMRLIHNIVKGNIHIPEGQENTPAADLIRRMLEKESSKRFKFEDICKHQWFVQNLPVGALNLNIERLAAANYHGVRQKPQEIMRIIKIALPDTQATPPAPHSVGPSSNQMLAGRTVTGATPVHQGRDATLSAPAQAHAHLPAQQPVQSSLATVTTAGPAPKKFLISQPIMHQALPTNTAPGWAAAPAAAPAWTEAGPSEAPANAAWPPAVGLSINPPAPLGDFAAGLATCSPDSMSVTDLFSRFPLELPIATVPGGAPAQVHSDANAELAAIFDQAPSSFNSALLESYMDPVPPHRVSLVGSEGGVLQPGSVQNGVLFTPDDIDINSLDLSILRDSDMVYMNMASLTLQLLPDGNQPRPDQS